MGLNSVLGNPDHVVAVYDVDDDLVSEVAAFLERSLVQGGAAIAIATPTHRQAFNAALTARGLCPEALTASGQYRSLDAAATLANFMRGDRPDADAFASVVGTLLDELTRSGRPMRLFGEMVGLLWADGNRAAAIELEKLWNDLASRHSFELVCGYPISSLETSADLTAVKRMCDQHSHIVALQTKSLPVPKYAAVTGHDHYDRLFVATPSVLRSMRHFVRDALHAWDADDLGTMAEIVASELASNAVQHARSPFWVSISRSSTAIRIEVRDASFDPPERVPANAHRAGGRGVSLIAAISHAWGTRDEVDGKTVWAEVSPASIW
jgi:anti-sigma regulatory factor (Ser/Thr protein kinase)